MGRVVGEPVAERVAGEQVDERVMSGQVERVVGEPVAERVAGEQEARVVGEQVDDLWDSDGEPTRGMDMFGRLFADAWPPAGWIDDPTATWMRDDEDDARGGQRRAIRGGSRSMLTRAESRTLKRSRGI